MELTNFLLSLGVSMDTYCYYIEEITYDRIETINTWHSIGVPPQDIIEKNSEWRMELPNIIKKQYPIFTPLQVEITCMIVNDSISSSYYLDCLFTSLNKAIARELGIELITDKLHLSLTGVQLN